MYLRIENPNEAPIEALTHMGVSTARGEKDKIGQFGSGLKHGINLLLRAAIYPIVFRGNTKNEYSLQADKVGDKPFNRIFIHSDGVKVKELGWSLEFGSIDWNSIDMALREFVSNALDQSDNDITKMSITKVQNIEGRRGYTRIYIPLTPKVEEYADKLDEKFLHFNGMQGDTVLDKVAEGMPNVYRKGVFVRQCGRNYSRIVSSLFDYNFGDELAIDECRNLSDYAANAAIARMVGKSEKALKKMFGTFIKGEDNYFETCNLSNYYLQEGKKELWQNTWKSVAGDAKITTKEIAQVVAKKGFKAVIIPNANWFEAMVAMGIPAATVNLSKAEKEGATIVKPNAIAKRTLRKVWGRLEKLCLTGNKPMPKLSVFVRPMNGESSIMGYYENNTVFIESEHQGNYQTVLEECAHYITGSGDNSRDFQDFAFKCAAMAMFRKELVTEKV